MKHPDENQTEGFKALWNIIHTEPTQADYRLVAQELASHDDRIEAVIHLANILHAMACVVEADCDQMSYEHGKEGDRYGDNPMAKDHYMSQVHYAYEGNRMANYCARVEEAHERDDELKDQYEGVEEAHDGEMTAEQAEKAIGEIL
jgi:hypothetical protein